MTDITDVTVVETKDSRGKPTLAVSVHVGEHVGLFSVPSGASTGSHEAYELREQDGGVQAAINNIRTIIRPALVGVDAQDQVRVDRLMCELDGTPNKSKLGGNAIIGVSIANAKAAAAAKSMQTYEHLRTLASMSASRRVPYLYMNYINGGKHAKSPLAFQEHILVPDTENVREAMEMATRIDTALSALLRAQYGEETAQSMGDEGGYVIQESDPLVPFQLLAHAIENAQLTGRMHMATDVAASSFYENGTYSIGNKQYSAEELMALHQKIAAQFPIISIEDPFHEESFAEFTRLQQAIPARLVGDDLTVTNQARITQAIAAQSIRAVIIKPNQVGTLSETLEAMKTAREGGVECIVSHRSGETMDDFIADLAFAFGAFGLKAGALRKSERRAKYERLAAISA